MDNTPTTPTEPQPASVLTPQSPMSPKKKKMIVLISSIVGALVVIGLVFLILFLTVWSVSKKDYQALGEAAQTTRTAYNESSSDFRSFYRAAAAGTASDKAREDLTASFDTYKQEVAKMADMKAMRDKDVKKAYDTFAEKNKKFETTVEAIIADAPAFAAIGDSCAASNVSKISQSSIDSLLANYDEVVGKCMSDLEKLKESKFTTLQDYATKLLGLYREQRNLIASMVDAAKAGDVAALNAAQSKISSQSMEFSSTARDFGTKFQKEVSDIEVTDELNAFLGVVRDKQ